MLSSLRYLILFLIILGCNATSKKAAAPTPTAEIPVIDPLPVVTPTPTPTPTPVPPVDDDDDDEVCEGDDEYGILKDKDDDCECPTVAALKSGKGKCGNGKEDED